MEILKYSAIVLLSVSGLIMFVFAVKSKKFFKTVFFNAFMGLILLSTIDLTAKFTGVYIPVNEYTVTGSAVYGIPALLMFLALKFVFI